jgi:hypothetical protein
MKMSDNLVDPLLALLRRHEAANAAFDLAADSNASEAERNHLFAACTRTMQAIIDRAPAATTAEGAAAALDHVLNDESLWHNSAYAGKDRGLGSGGRHQCKRCLDRAPFWAVVDAEAYFGPGGLPRVAFGDRDTASQCRLPKT